VPFLAGFLLIGVALWVRLRVEDSPVFQDVRRRQTVVKLPLVEALKRYPRSVLVGIGAHVCDTAAAYMYATFTVAYATEELGMSKGVVLGALGLPKGHETVAEAIADPELSDFVHRLLNEELIPTVPTDLDPEGYVERMLERFRNPRIEHRLEQIATGAEHKIAQRLLPAADELRAAGREPVLISRVVAAADELRLGK